MGLLRGRSRPERPLVDPDKQRAWFTKLELDESQKLFLENVWLAYVVWWDRRSTTARARYHLSRGVVVVGAAVTPSLIGFSVGSDDPPDAVEWAAWATGLLVAIAAALEALFHWGDVWREKRSAGELLKIEGWRFFQLAAPYTAFETHRQAFPSFAAAVTDRVGAEIGDYMRVVAEREKGQREDDQSDTDGKCTPTVK